VSDKICVNLAQPVNSTLLSAISAYGGGGNGGNISQTPIDLVRSPKRVLMPEHGAVVFESRHSPGFVGQLKDDYAKFLLVIDGHAQWESGGHKYMLGPNTLSHIAVQIEHTQKDLPKTPVTLYAIHYRSDLLSPQLAGELLRGGMLLVNLSGARVGQSRQVRSIFQEMLFEQETGQTGWEMVLRARLIDLAVLTIRLMQRLRGAEPVFRRGDQSAERVANYAVRLKSQFFRPETLDEAARSVSLSRRQFTDIFWNVTGQTWRQYVLDLRLKHAFKLLSQTDKSVTAIAFESGFDELSHFYHLFKAAFGHPPMFYREKNRPPPLNVQSFSVEREA
jgi:AraC-like DNA-binding protein